MTQTKKFSEFNGPSPIQNGDIVVGLRGSDNWQFTGVGAGGSGGSITLIVDQVAHGLTAGNWVRVDATGAYVKAQSDTAEHAEIAGTVKSIESANQFTLQTVGFVSAGVFTGLVPGSVYFLSNVTPGAMTLTEPTINGQISIPVFIAVTDTTGWIRQWRGFVNGGQPPAINGGSGNNPNIVTINQSLHGLSVSQIVRLNGSIDYVLAQADTFAHSQAIGVVIQVIDVNNFVLQTAGYSVGIITQDDTGTPVVPGDVYYLSSTVPGSITSTAPTALGQATKPMFICEQAGGSPAGYILEQRPLEIDTTNTDNTIVDVTQAAHGFVVGDLLYVSGSLTYAKGIATALATSQVVGVVVNVPSVNNFILQTSGYNVGAFTFDALGNALVPGTIYYLSTTVAGKMQATIPTTNGQVTKPIFSCEQTFGMTGLNAGYIMEQRPLLIAPSGGGSGELILSIAAPNGSNVLDLPGIFDGTYQDVYMVARNVRVQNTATGTFYATVLAMRLYTGGTLRTTPYIATTPGSGSQNASSTLGAISIPFYTVSAADVRFALPYVVNGGSSLFGTPTITSPGQYTYVGVINSTVEFFGLDSNNTSKQLRYTSMFNPELGVPFQNNSGYFSSFQQMIAAGVYAADTFPITGLHFQLFPVNCVFISGTFSFYGTRA